MQAGILNDTIDLYKPVTETNEYGSNTIIWEYVDTVRAYVKQTGMNRTVSENEVFYPNYKQFIIRAYYQVEEYWRVSYHECMYNIESIDYDRHMNQKTLTTTRVNE